MAKYDFSIRYSGEALNDGRIPIKDLAPSLLSISDAFQEMQSSLYPHQDPVSLDIQATEKGSFLIDLILTNGHDVFSKAVDLFSGRESEAMVNLIEIATGIFGVLTFIKTAKNLKIKSKKDLGNDRVKITFDDETTIEIPNQAFVAYQDIELRKKVNEFVRPLEKDGITNIEFSKEQVITVSLSKNDVKYFEVPATKDKELESSERTVFLQIINVSFTNEKWKLTDGNSTFFAKIKDREFLEAIAKHQQQFGANDTLEVLLQTNQKITDKGLRADYIVKKVINHIKANKQIEIDFDEE
jgi:hypothetical protein